MQHSNDQQGTLICRIGNQITMHLPEAQPLRCQVRTPVALVGRRDKRLDGIANVFDHAVSRFRIVFSDVLPDFIEVRENFGVENITAHAGLFRRVSRFWRNRANTSSPSMGSTRPLLMSE